MSIQDDLNPKIMIVDDDEDTLNFIRLVLEQAGFQVVTALSGQEAFTKLYQNRLDLILLDIMMPEIDGMKFLKLLKADNSLRDIPVMMITAKTAIKDQLVALQEDAIDYICKPFAPNELVYHINTVLKKCHTINPDKIRTVPNRPAEYMAIRSEWLRLKSILYDRISELPTIQAVLDDLRHLTQKQQRLGVFYLGFDHHTALEAIRGWQAYDLMISNVAKTITELKKEMLDRSDIVAINNVRGDEFVIFMSLADIETNQQALQLWAKIFERRLREHPLLTKAPLLPRLNCGTALLILDPLIRFERQLFQAIDLAKAIALNVRCSLEAEQIEQLKYLIENNKLATLFQKIISVESGDIFGYEALTRGQNSTFEDAEALFSFAETNELFLQLDQQCRYNAIHFGAKLLPRAKIFINTTASVIYHPDFLGEAFISKIKEAGLSNNDIVIELTERGVARDQGAFKNALRYLKSQGMAVAIDDMGAGYSTLKLLTEVEPQYLKADISIIRQIDQNLIKRELLGLLIDFGSKINAKVIAEGIETKAEFDTVQNMGVTLAQGYYWGLPEALKEGRK